MTRFVGSTDQTRARVRSARFGLKLERPDLQTDWEKHGMAALKEYREKFVDR